MAKHRTAEAIWIESRARWQINVQRDGKRKTFTSSTPGRKGKHEAEAKADDWLDAGQPDDMRFDAAWAVYLDHIRRNTGTSNYHDIESIGRIWVLPALAGKRLSKIRLADLQGIVTSCGEAGRSLRTCKNVRDKISGFFRFAADHDWEYAVDPSRVKLPTQARAATRQILHLDSLRMLFSDASITRRGVTEDSFYIHAYRFLVLTGYRRGELCGFQGSDYDPPVLTVRRSINHFREITQGKNTNARRTNVLSRRAQAVLADQRAMLKSRGIISPWLFPSPDGSVLNPADLTNHWLRVYAPQHGIRCSLHELRHTFVSIVKLEMPEALLKDVIGHSASMDTTGIYGHEIDGEKQRAADIIDNIFDRMLSP